VTLELGGKKPLAVMEQRSHALLVLTLRGGKGGLTGRD
jgi:hypothetical protein